MLHGSFGVGLVALCGVPVFICGWPIMSWVSASTLMLKSISRVPLAFLLQKQFRWCSGREVSADAISKAFDSVFVPRSACRWAHDSKTAPRFIKRLGSLIRRSAFKVQHATDDAGLKHPSVTAPRMHLQEDLYDLSLDCFRQLAEARRHEES